MRPKLQRHRRLVALFGATVLALIGSGTLGQATATAAASHALIQGTGSSWSANAVNQWISDVSSNGLQVVFTGSGSAQGRKDFANGTTDYAVTDIGYQGKDPVTGEDDTNCIPGQPCRQFAYEPIVAGGTSFPYQIQQAGKLIRNLRLSGQTIAKIFTYQITNWDDPQIKADNNGRSLPNLPIVPVVHSEGSGSTAQFSAFLNDQYPSIWQPFVGAKGPTEYWPPPSGGKGIAQSGSDGVMNFISSSAANGAIGYDEYSYPLAKGWPVAKVKNAAGYYTLPDQYNVAVALTKAQINMDKTSPNYLLQNLHNVYIYNDARVYPLSSYSYFLIPTGSSDPRMTTAKRQTLADYLYFSVCQGQKEMGPIGYSPLPINLVQASFAQTAKLKTADPNVDLTKRDVTTCQNPTFVAGRPNENHLADIAPLPQSCDKQGAGPCGSDNTGTGGNPPPGTGSTAPNNNNNSTAPGNNNNSSAPGSNNHNSTGPGGNNSTAPGNNNNSTAPGNNNNNSTAPGNVGGSGSATPGSGNGSTAADGGGSSSANVVVNPDTGESSTVGAGGGVNQAAAALPVSTNLADYSQPGKGVLGTLAVVEILAILIAPPAVYAVLRRRKRAGA